MENSAQGGKGNGIDRLERVTTEYVETEDRLRITGETEGRHLTVLWLTQRLARRLLPPLFEWLAGRERDLPRADLLQEFAQQRAVAAMEPQAPVRPAGSARAWLVASIDVTRGADAVELTFKGSRPDEAVRLAMAPLHARQWLAILHANFRKAGWPVDAWPDWFAPTDAGTASRPPSVVLH